MNLDSLSIIIVSWNTRQLLEKCLESILSNPSCSPSDIWVVDNHSTDESQKMVRERFSTVHLIENSVNVGFARANNQAIEQCTGKYILMLNPDTMVEACALEVLVNFLEENPAAGAVGAKLLNQDGSMQVSSYPWPTIPREILRMFYLNRIFPYTEYPQTKWKTDVAQEVDVIIGACLLVRREVFDRIGYFDEDYFIYTEEVDLCYRIRRAGWRLYWVPQAEVVHIGGQSTQQVPAEMFLNLYQSKIKYFQKHFGNLAARTYILILVFASLLRIALTPVILLENAVNRQRHLTLVDHYWRLFLFLLGMRKSSEI